MTGRGSMWSDTPHDPQKITETRVMPPAKASWASRRPNCRFDWSGSPHPGQIGGMSRCIGTLAFSQSKQRIATSPTAGLRRDPSCPVPSVLAAREQSRRAVLRCGHQGNHRRSGASFGALADEAGNTHNIGCQVRFPMLFDRRWRPIYVHAPVAAAATTLMQRRCPADDHPQGMAKST
jgi:hypothetical protein